MAAEIEYARSFALTAAQYQDTQLTGRIIAAREQLARQWPQLPHEADEEYILPPVGRAHARVIHGTSLRLVYNVTDRGVLLIAVVGE